MTHLENLRRSSDVMVVDSAAHIPAEDFERHLKHAGILFGKIEPEKPMTTNRTKERSSDERCGCKRVVTCHGDEGVDSSDCRLHWEPDYENLCD